MRLNWSWKLQTALDVLKISFWYFDWWFLYKTERLIFCYSFWSKMCLTVFILRGVNVFVWKSKQLLTKSFSEFLCSLWKNLQKHLSGFFQAFNKIINLFFCIVKSQTSDCQVKSELLHLNIDLFIPPMRLTTKWFPWKYIPDIFFCLHGNDKIFLTVDKFF